MVSHKTKYVPSSAKKGTPKRAVDRIGVKSPRFSPARTSRSATRVSEWMSSASATTSNGAAVVSCFATEATNDFIDGFTLPFRWVASAAATVISIPVETVKRVYRTVHNASVTRAQTVKMMTKMDKRLKKLEAEVNSIKTHLNFASVSVPATPLLRTPAHTPQIPAVTPLVSTAPPPPAPPPPPPAMPVAGGLKLKKRSAAAAGLTSESAPAPVPVKSNVASTTASPSAANKRVMPPRTAISLSDLTAVKLKRVSPRTRPALGARAPSASDAQPQEPVVSAGILGAGISALRKVQKSPGGTPMRPRPAAAAHAHAHAHAHSLPKLPADMLPAPTSRPSSRPSSSSSFSRPADVPSFAKASLPTPPAPAVIAEPLAFSPGVVPPATGTPILPRAHATQQRRASPSTATHAATALAGSNSENIFAVPLKPAQKTVKVSASVGTGKKAGSPLRVSAAVNKENMPPAPALVR